MRLTDYSSVREDNLGMVHNVPVGYTAYAQAKHVQLVEKNPEAAIPLFWAAINAGDRVESALKDMAISNLGWAYMQQLNYPAAELVYRKSLHFDADGNKACNLDVCLIKQRKMEEAVAVLASINSMDKKDATSVDRAEQLLKEIKESGDELRMVEWGAEIDYNIARKRHRRLPVFEEITTLNVVSD
ncbi:hypothetical protein KI387_026210 [Taxus chinensis]|uniref:Uncharacterized protein n=1 Tax=Taxus chinensis TaxID=29808 RepID=A0AA38BZ50_TAXCH|nr:hypothetical protein KI387_043283 [Taxus chinensis]KAH9311175.1 hypothetical protein KI387_026210 [Taxus chinensis]